MAVNSKKIDVNSLVKGMYISKLDRPWIETSYPIEGFYIQNDHDIRQLRNLCQSVYIDVDLTKLHIDVGKIADNPGTHLSNLSGQSILESKTRLQQDSRSASTLNKQLRHDLKRYTRKVPFEKEFKTASSLYQTLTHSATELLAEVATGKRVDSKHINHIAKKMVDSIIRNPDAFLWLSRLKAKDTHSHNRSIRSAIWAIAFGRYLNLPKKQLNELALAVLLANTGKARLPRKLLEQSDDLQGEALKTYQTHVELSVQLLKNIGLPAPVINIVASHCERYNGSGYPRQLSRDNIIFPAQIAGLVSYYEQITNHRQAQKSLDATRAMEHLYQLRHSLFQSELVEEFIQSMGIYPAGSLIQLNSREIAVIVEQNEQQRLLPRVVILRDKDKNPVTDFRILDLSSIKAKNGSMPKIINSVPPNSYNIDAQEIMSSLLKADKHWSIRKFFS